jgi:PiT family inorganic phosphate transporter
LNNVRWTTVRDMVLAWVVTLPASAMLSALAYALLSRFV